MSNEITLINDQIKAPNVRLIDKEGSQIGVVSLDNALSEARKDELDLVLVAPNANPPVCKILDWGKEQYRAKKAAKAAKANSTKVEIKEIQLRPVTDDHDLEIKLNRAKKFLKEGKKVRFFMRFRGREASHKEIGMEKMKDIMEGLENIDIEKAPSFAGNNIMMVLAPESEKSK